MFVIRVAMEKLRGFCFCLKCWEQARAGGRGGQGQAATKAGSIRRGFAAHVEDGMEEEKTLGEQDPSSITLSASKKKEDRANPVLLTALLVPIIENLR